ncbi:MULTISPECIES: hypothetical protein [Mycobacteriaceae]|uniref:Intersectin-EH binding protein Ibp1 n=2 Tax=Mycobacteriaceae TaxID=1762 RepID=A0A1X0B477_9MYCO|nr:MULTISPECIES: hypothetical protein [Mycobacteriaceae]MCV7159456.1 intersectin-EH binding protein Ibp1 [Mycolicibacterium brisbanense]OBC16304.1 intersectin-EH binding protein Ibp1 [Mycobacterium sp. 852013-50091_SCH5140682]ORA37152.1 intersectin-EH binding protein Ibp1 [Mycobacterium aquaticum]GAS92243.1 intersectin-EH binding protein Ibp1 [Mycolicibacterium brisbanense]
MAISQLSARRFIVAGGLALAIVGAPALTAFTLPATALADCPSGESEDLFTGMCTSDIAPNTPSINSAPDQLPQIDGIPCTGGNSGQCIGLSEEQQAQGPQPVPQSTVGSSPTVTGSIG